MTGKYIKIIYPVSIRNVRGHEKSTSLTKELDYKISLGGRGNGRHKFFASFGLVLMPPSWS